MNFLSAITIKTKLLAIVVALTLPILYLSYLYFDEQITSVENKKLELTGLEYQEKIRPLLQLIAQHRGVTSSYFSGNENLKSKIEQIASNIDTVMIAVSDYQEQWGHLFNTEATLNLIQQDWSSLKKDNLKIRKRENFERHSNLVKQVQKYLNQVANESGLKNDLNQTTAYLVYLTTVDIPKVLEELGKLRGLTSAIATRQYLEDGENSTVLAYQMNVTNAVDGFNETLRGVFLEDQKVKELFSEKLEKFEVLSGNYLNKLDVLMSDVMVLMTANGKSTSIKVRKR